MTDVTITPTVDGATVALEHAPLAALLTRLASAFVDHRASDAFDQVVDAVRHIESPPRHTDEALTEFYERQRDTALGVLVGHHRVQAAFSIELDLEQMSRTVDDFIVVWAECGKERHP